LIEKFVALRNKPKKKRSIARCHLLEGRASKKNIKAKRIELIIIVFRALYFATIQLDIGRPITKPNGNAKSIKPHCASLRPNLFCTSGMREAQLAVIIPERKKKISVIHRSFSFESVPNNMDTKIG
jgi:hypothetical protein